MKTVEGVVFRKLWNRKFVKCTQWPQTKLKDLGIKGTLHICTVVPRVPNFCPFNSMISHFWDAQGQKYQKACYIHLRAPTFRPFHSTMSCFWVTCQFLEKCSEWPQMTLTWSMSKIPTCMLHTPQGPKFSSVSLHDKPFLSYSPFLEKCTEWPQTTWTWSRSKIPTYILHTPRRPKFLSVSIYDEPFSEKCTVWPQNDLDMFKITNTNMHITYTPEAQIFIRFTLQ